MIKYLERVPFIKAAAARFVDQQIMTPNPTNRPLWMSSPALAGTAQLKSLLLCLVILLVLDY